jgi:hypothetical protein
MWYDWAIRGKEGVGKWMLWERLRRWRRGFKYLLLAAAGAVVVLTRDSDFRGGAPNEFPEVNIAAANEAWLLVR